MGQQKDTVSRRKRAKQEHIGECKGNFVCFWRFNYNKCKYLQQKKAIDSNTRELESVSKKVESLKNDPCLTELESRKNQKIKLSQKKGNVMMEITELKKGVLNEEDFEEMES